MSTPYSRKWRPNSTGFTSVELLAAISVAILGIALASGMVQAGKHHIYRQSTELEASQAARAAMDTVLRELRLGGACLPETGEFIALEAVDNGTTDEVTTRYGITSTSDLSCVQTSLATIATAGGNSLSVVETTGYEQGHLVYLRHTDGSGEYHKIASLDGANQRISLASTLSKDFPATSGVYAIDERRFFIDASQPAAPLLMYQVDDNPAQPFALGVEALDLQYELSDGSLLDQPAGEQQWRSIRQIHVSLTARSVETDDSGTPYRRSYRLAIKPRNLLNS